MKIGGTWVHNPRKEKKMMVSFSSTSAYNFFSASYFVFLKFTFHFYNYDSDATLMPYLLVLIYICFIIYDIIFVWMKWICTITLHIDRQLQDDWINIVFLICTNTFYVYCFLFFFLPSSSFFCLSYCHVWRLFLYVSKCHIRAVRDT